MKTLLCVLSSALLGITFGSRLMPVSEIAQAEVRKHFSAHEIRGTKQKAMRRRRVACRNRKDDDGDGLIDLLDPGCRSRRDRSEVNPVGGLPDLGENASLNGRRPFPDNNPWNTPIDNQEVDSNSAALIASIGINTEIHPDFGTEWEGAPIGIPYVIVSGNQSPVSVSFDYDDESDPGPYPVPANPPIEGGPDSDGDRHIIMIDRDNWTLYELYSAFRNSNGTWRAGSGAIFNLNSNSLRPAGWTSADAAGLPIFPGLVRYDEVVERGEINHALRFTCSRTRRAYVYPARHWASSNSDPSLPPMGMRVRLKADFDISPFPTAVQVILRALKKYGMILADNGSDWYISGAPDPRWNDDDLSELESLQGSDFEVVKMSGLVVGD